MKTRPILHGLLALVLATFLFACQRGAETQQQTSQSPEAQGGEKQAAQEASKPQPVTVPAGTTLTVRIVQGIDSGKITQGSAFEGTLAAPLVANGVEVAPVGSTVMGKVTHVVSAGRLNRPAELSLVLTSLTPQGGGKVRISTQAWSKKGESHKKRNVEMIGGGGGVGALIGAIAGGKKGAAIGAAAGAGAGTGMAAATGKKEIVLPPETKLTFKLSSSAEFPGM